jgi:hypothetical protein
MAMMRSTPLFPELLPALLLKISCRGRSIKTPRARLVLQTTNGCRNGHKVSLCLGHFHEFPSKWLQESKLHVSSISMMHCTMNDGVFKHIP